MRLTVGIQDAPEQTYSELSSIAALKFLPSTPVDLVYVMESLGKADKLIGASALLDSVSGSSFFSMQKTTAKHAMQHAAQLAGEMELKATPHLFSGQIANRLVQFVHENHADMLVLGSGEKTRLEGLMVGSVGRKSIISSPVSVLITKGRGLPKTNLKVLLATDHSPYMSRCLRLLNDYAPQGLSELVIASVYPDHQFTSIIGSTMRGKEKAEDEILLQLEADNLEALEKLGKLRCTMKSRVEVGPVSESLLRIMAEEKADLLIMGAQGHGFMERLAMGSVSLDLALTAPKSVLVLRARS